MGKVVAIFDNYIVVAGGPGWSGYYFVDPDKCWAADDGEQRRLQNIKVGMLVAFDSWHLNASKDELLKVARAIK